MRGNLKESSFKRWRKRVNSSVSQKKRFNIIIDTNREYIYF